MSWRSNIFPIAMDVPAEKTIEGPKTVLQIAIPSWFHCTSLMDVVLALSTPFQDVGCWFVATQAERLVLTRHTDYFYRSTFSLLVCVEVHKVK